MTDAPEQTDGVEPSDEQKQQLAQAVEQLAQMLTLHMPTLAQSDLEGFARFCFDRVAEQADMLDIYADAADPAGQKVKPWWGYGLTDRNGAELLVKAPKAIAEAVKAPQTLFNFVSIVGLLVNPLCRGILGVNGLRIRFFQCDPEAPKPQQPLITA